MTHTALILLCLLCLFGAFLSCLWLCYDVSYMLAYRLSTMTPIENVKQESYRASLILFYTEKAEQYGEWRPETPFYRAKVAVEWNLSRIAQLELVRAKKFAPYAWWVRATSNMWKEKVEGRPRGE